MGCHRHYLGAGPVDCLKYGGRVSDGRVSDGYQPVPGFPAQQLAGTGAEEDESRVGQSPVLLRAGPQEATFISALGRDRQQPDQGCHHRDDYVCQPGVLSKAQAEAHQIGCPAAQRIADQSHDQIVAEQSCCAHRPMAGLHQRGASIRCGLGGGSRRARMAPTIFCGDGQTTHPPGERRAAGSMQCRRRTPSDRDDYRSRTAGK